MLAPLRLIVGHETSMTEGKFTPSTIASDSMVTHDLGRPVFDPIAGLSVFGRSLPAFYLLAMARQQGAKTAIVEHLPDLPTAGNELVFQQDGRGDSATRRLDRISFWRSEFAEDSIQNADARGFLGYMIVETTAASASRDSTANVFEAILATPEQPGAFIPNTLTTSVTIGGSSYPVTGIPFFEGDGYLRSCGVTSSQTLLSLLLRRRVALSEIYASLTGDGDCPENLANGLTLKQISSLLESFGSQVHVFDSSAQATRDVYDFYPARLQLVDAINAGGGALLGFSAGAENNFFSHILPIYGFTVQPRALEYYLNRYYYSIDSSTRYSTLSPWVTDYLCSDQNFGPYFSLGTHGQPVERPLTVIQVLPPSTRSTAMHATLATTEFLYQIASAAPSAHKTCWEQLLHELHDGTIILNAVLMPRDAYLRLLRNMRDWQNQREATETVAVLRESLSAESFWVVEVTGPRLFHQFLKYGEVLVDATTPPGTDALQPVVARLPGSYWVPDEDDHIVSFRSTMDEATALSTESGPQRFSMHTQYEYDVALSFAGEDREVARELASLLARRRVRIFFDEYEKAQLWGKNLYQHLQSVYRHKARFCVLFLSHHYAEKLWTKHELESAQARAFKESSEYILPLKLDDTEIPGINPTTGYVDVRVDSIGHIAELVLEKLNY
jgi:hypothetical protein